MASGIALMTRRPFLKSIVRSAEIDCAQCFVQARAVVRSIVPQILVYKSKAFTYLQNRISFREMPAEEQMSNIAVI